MGTENVATMSDGVQIPYLIDGNPEPNAPLIVLCNPSLVDYSFWDEFLTLFRAKPQSEPYRFLRYNNRGRVPNNTNTTNAPLTLDRLTEDVVAILDTINVDKAMAMTGISLGGLTVVNLARKYPGRVGAVMPCDFFPESPPSNPAVWNSRLDIARKDPLSPRDADGVRICGSDLAKVTVERWLSPKSVNGGLEKSKIDGLVKMVEENRLDGFVSIVEAVSCYDLQEGLAEATVPAVLVAGRDDAPVLAPMKDMAGVYGDGAGAEFKIIEDAGHLPVVDQPEEFVGIFAEFLEVTLVQSQ